jgi:hypothetical protein
MKNIKNKKIHLVDKKQKKKIKEKTKEKTKKSPHNFSNFYVVGDISIFIIKCDADSAVARRRRFWLNLF